MKLNRKAMVLAVGAALAAPGVHAQITSPAGSAWEFYGKIYPELARINGGGATPPAGTTISTLASITNAGRSNLVNRGEMLVGNSYIGFRGSKSLGSGLKAIWQIEQTVPIDEGGSAAADTGTLATRDSFLGVDGGWGTLRLGFMDTPFKRSGDVLGFLGISSGNFVQTNPVLRQVGFGQGNNGPSRAARFHERRGNAIDFASRTYFGGLQYLAQYSVGNPSETSKTSGAGAGAGARPLDPRFISMALKWESGPWYFAAMHETHFDMFGGSANVPAAQKNDADANVNSKDMAAQVTGMFKIAGHTFEADYIRKSYKENAGKSATPNGRFESYKNNAFMVAWEGRWSNQWRTAVTYVSANAGTCSLFNAACSTTGLEGKQLSLGGSYYIDPSTYVFLIGSKIDNGTSARYDNVSNGSPATGEDVKQYALGLAHNF
ncbi:MAG: porin [Betaproteobacteria bacterium]|nr:MAG: porin [Betaproteobacteria bacterium]